MKSPSYKELSHCLACGGNSALAPYLSLGVQPLANSYRRPNDTSEEQKFPLAVNHCQLCHHSQLTIAVNPDLLYRDYLYVSGTTKTFRKHQEQLARRAIRAFEKSPQQMRVLDIASNDGSQLESFRALGCEVYGVDPAVNLRTITLEKDIDVDVAYFDEEWARQQKKRDDEPYDIITATNVLGHVSDPYSILCGIQHLLAPDGIAIIEFPYGKNILQHGEFDQWYHEHHSEFTVNSFHALVRRCGLAIRDILETPIHGGSIRFTLGHYTKPQTFTGYMETVGHYRKVENEAGLYSDAAYEAFQERVDETCKALILETEKQKFLGRKTVGYGASAKLNSVLNYTRIELDWICDDTPMKHGYVTPGQRIPIVGTDSLLGPDRLAIVLGAWNFASEIQQKIASIRKQLPGRDVLITYVPEVRCT